MMRSKLQKFKPNFKIFQLASNALTEKLHLQLVDLSSTMLPVKICWVNSDANYNPISTVFTDF